MTNINICPECGTELSADAPEGLCPKCLINKGTSIDANENDNMNHIEPSPVRNDVVEESEGRYTHVRELGKEE